MNIIILSLLIITGLLSSAIYFTYDTIPAYAQQETILTVFEEGSVYKKTDLGNNLVLWQSKLPQVFDGTNWKNYVYSDNPTYIRFESEGIAIDFFKDTCAFKLYDEGIIGDKNPSIESLSHTVKKDGIEINLTCSISPVTTTPESISFETVSSDGITKVLTKYFIHYITGMEWTFEPENFDTKQSTIEITDSCYKCIPEKIDGDKIYFQDYIYDTKNNSIDKFTKEDTGHHTLKEQKTIGEDFSFTYEVTLDKNEKAVIDPTFSSNNPTLDMYIATNVAAGAACPSASWTKVNTTIVNTEAASDGAGGDCSRGYFEWDISSIPDNAVVSDTDFKFDVQSVASARNCDYMEINNKASTTSAANVWTDIGDGTVFVNNDATCTTAGNDKLIDLGASADTDVMAHLSSALDWWAVGTKLESESRDASSHNSRIVDESGTSPTPAPTLEIVYVGTPDAPTNLLTNTQSTSEIRIRWDAPSSCATITCSGYKIFRESPTGNGWTVLVQNTTTQTTNYNNTGLTAGTQYNYMVAAYNINGVGDNSTAHANYTITNAPTALTATTISFTQINLAWTAPSGTVNGYKIERESPVGGGFATIVSNTTTTDVTYSNTGLTQNTIYNYRVSAHNLGGTSAISNTAFNTTFGNIIATLQFNFNRTGDTIELLPRVNLTGGTPSPTITNIQILQNGSSINNTALSIPISIGQSKPLGRTFVNQLDSDFVYNFTGTALIQNSSGNFPYRTTIYKSVPYTGNYVTSTEGNLQINYTYSRTNSYNDLNIVINREILPANTECNFRDELFEVGEWINVTNLGWYNHTASVVPTQNIYVSCYNDLLMFSFTSYGGNNATLAFVDYTNQLGTFAGVPIPFLFVLLLAGLFTGRSAITGIIFVTITIGVMGVMGFLPDINGDPAVGGVTWALVVFLTGIGVFVGKKYF